MSLQSPLDHLKKYYIFFKKGKNKNKNKEIKVRWLENLKRLVRQKLGHFRCLENPHRAGRQKLGNKVKIVPLIRKLAKG